MPYSQNPHLPKVRAKAVDLVRIKGWSMSQTARYIGVHKATISKWIKRAPRCRAYKIPTRSSRPHTSPNRIDVDIERRIVEIRMKKGRCAQVIHAQLLRKGLMVSESTVKRVLQRYGLVKKRSPWKKYHLSGDRPNPLKPGLLVQTDTIHIIQTQKDRMYIFTLIDCYSRWAFAKARQRIGAGVALEFIRQAQQISPFSFHCIQSDHGPEFSTHFTERLKVQGIRHRHSRVRKPNDNAFVERFNRTLQDELKSEITRYRHNMKRLNYEITQYMKYYNNERLRMGINFQTPRETLPRS